MFRRFYDPYNDESRSGPLKGYDTAQVCLNGQPINEFAESQPAHNAKFCDKCGAETITACPKCNATIKGHYHSPGVLAFSNYKPPAFCYQCGLPYPWTTSRLNAARELTNELENLDEQERESLSKSLDDLIRETPSTPVAVNRFKKLVKKAGSVAADGLKSILVDVITEAAKKQLWP